MMRNDVAMDAGGNNQAAILDVGILGRLFCSFQTVSNLLLLPDAKC
jgi:hypothetical protein